MNKRILLVAHESDILESFPVTLRLAGHKVLMAHGGLHGIKQARELSPDLIVLDTSLPDLDGPTVLEILQKLPSTAGIPTLLLKPRPHPLMPAQLRAAGVRAGSTESLDPAQLLWQVGEALAQCQLLDEMEMAAEIA